jgi:biopolymer transport protein ExbB/TolQ
MELVLRGVAIGIVVAIAAFVLYNHWQERWGTNHF